MSPHLAAELARTLGLSRAVETGTYTGAGAAALAPIFAEVVTIELSPDLHRRAAETLRSIANVASMQGDSRERLAPLAGEGVPTLYFLDGHWSGGPTAGADDECPVLAEIATIGAGHPDDCLVIDDARLFTAPPPAPHDPAQWPTLIELLDAIRAVRPEHHVTLLSDQVITVGEITIDLVRHRVTRSGEDIHFTPTEFDLLRVLASNAGKVLTHRQLLERVWGNYASENAQQLRVYVNYVRRKLEVDPAHPRLILTEPGIGYRLRD